MLSILGMVHLQQSLEQATLHWQVYGQVGQPPELQMSWRSASQFKTLTRSSQPHRPFGKEKRTAISSNVVHSTVTQAAIHGDFHLVVPSCRDRSGVSRHVHVNSSQRDFRTFPKTDRATLVRHVAPSKSCDSRLTLSWLADQHRGASLHNASSATWDVTSDGTRMEPRRGASVHGCICLKKC